MNRSSVVFLCVAWAVAVTVYFIAFDDKLWTNSIVGGCYHGCTAATNRLRFGLIAGLPAILATVAWIYRATVKTYASEQRPPRDQ